MPTEREIEAAIRAINLSDNEPNRQIMRAALEAAERERWQPIEIVPVPVDNKHLILVVGGNYSRPVFVYPSWTALKGKRPTHWMMAPTMPIDRATHTTAEPVTRKG